MTGSVDLLGTVWCDDVETRTGVLGTVSTFSQWEDVRYTAYVYCALW